VGCGSSQIRDVAGGNQVKVGAFKQVEVRSNTRRHA
jgi:hypothetical protein